MTNRDYLRSLSNEELAKLMAEENTCDYLIETCLDCICSKCITKWLDAKRETSVKKGQVREIDSHKWLVGSVSINRDICGMVSETGVIRYVPTDIVDTWEIVTDETEEIFYNKITHNLYNKISNILKEINEKI